MTRFGYLTPADHLHQSETFVRYFDRSGRTEWEPLFDWWGGHQCKDFHPGDAEAIRQIVSEIMVAGGASVLVDPLDWLEIGRDPAEEGAA